MTERYLIARDLMQNRTMDFYLHPNGTLLIDEEDREFPFTVESEVVYALLTYLEEHKEQIEAARKQWIQNVIDMKQMYPHNEFPPRFEFVDVPEEE
jgi:hypothetical protein